MIFLTEASERTNEAAPSVPPGTSTVTDMPGIFGMLATCDSILDFTFMLSKDGSGECF